MILSYIEYLFENIEDKIPLYFSFELRKVLKDIISSKKEGYEVAEFLLKKHLSEDHEDDANYIDITKTNDKLSFISMNRVKRFWDKGEENPGMSFKDWSQRMWYDQESGIDIKKKVWVDQRTEVFVGRFVNRVYEKSKSSISSSNLEKFVNLYKSTYDKFNSKFSMFEIVKGEQIKKWYLKDNYETQLGQLGSSCMRHLSCQNYFGIYVENPEVVSLLILKNDDGDKIKGRALIWKLKNGETFMDRIYTNKDSDMILFEEFGEKNGILTKSEINYLKLRNLEVKLEEAKFDYYPYLDTFICLNVDEKTLSPNEDLWPGEGYIKLDSTSGSYTRADVVWSEYNGDWILREDAVFCERREEWVYRSDATYLEYVDEWAHPNDEISYSKYNGDNYYYQDVVHSNILGSDILFDDAISIVINRRLDDDYIHKDFEKTLINIEIEGESYKVPSEKIINWKGENIFRDEYIDLIKNEKIEEVSEKDFEEYILNLRIDIDKNRIILSKYDLYYMGYPLSDFYDFIKILILESENIKRDGLTSIRLSITKNKLYDNLKEHVKESAFGSKFCTKMWTVTRSLVSHIIKDPKMLKHYLERTT